MQNQPDTFITITTETAVMYSLPEILMHKQHLHVISNILHTQ